MAVNKFFLVVRDDDKSTFSVEGPMADDTEWIDAVIQAQSKGRQVKCFSVPGAQDSTQLRVRYAAQEKLVNVPSGSILFPKF